MMIVPTIRASFARQDAQKVIFLLGGGDSELVNAATDRLEEAGLDALLDDPRTRNALLTNPSVSVSPQMIAYVLVRQSLLEGRIQSRSNVPNPDSPVSAGTFSSSPKASSVCGRSAIWARVSASHSSTSS